MIELKHIARLPEVVVVLLNASRVKGRSAIVVWFGIQRFSLVRGSGATEGRAVGEKDQSGRVGSGGDKS